MSTSIRFYLTVLAGAWVLGTSSAAWSQGAGAAGRFLAISGEVRVLGANGASRLAERASDFREGETIVTGPTGLAQLRMSDGGLISVRSDTELKLDQYSYAKDDRSNSFIASIVKGGFRAITGLIGQQNRQNFRVATPTVTIGVRGTHFEVVHMLQPAGEVPAGTYKRVYEGITTMQTRAGNLLVVNRDQTAFAALIGTTPPVIVAPPAVIFGRPTPVPRPTPQVMRDEKGESDRASKGAIKGEDRGLKGRADTRFDRETIVTPLEPARPAPTTPVLVSPIDAPRTVTPISPTLVAPIQTAPTTIQPATTLPTAPVLKIETAPILTPIQTAPVAPIQTTPTIIQTAPILTAPILTAPITTIQPAPTTTIQTTPILTAPTTPIKR